MSEHSEASVTAAILKHFNGVRSQGEGNRYVVAVQVNNGAGFGFGRTLDAIVFDTWPSKGLGLEGIEVKVSKGDLRRELQHPDKSAQFIEYLDTFSICAPKEVLADGMRDLIPKRWGIYTLTDEGALRTVRKPLYLHDDGRDRKVLDRSIAAAFCRALVQRSLSREAENAAHDRGYEQGVAWSKREADSLRFERNNLVDRIKEFEEASGVQIDSYRGQQQIGEAVKFVLAGGIDSKLPYNADVRQLGERLLAFADELDALKEKMSVPAGGAL